MSNDQVRDESLTVTHGNETSRINELERCSPDGSPSKFSQKKGLFSNDQEVFIDSQSPLILLSDTNGHTPTPKFANKKLPPIKTRGENGEYNALGAKSFENTNAKQLSFITDHDTTKAGNEATPNGEANGKEGHPSETDTNAPPSPDKVPNKDDEEQEKDIFGDGQPKEEELPPWKKRVKKILDHTAFSLFIGVFTIYALFGDDIRIMATTASADIVFDVFTIIALLAFTLEIIFTLIVDKKYLWSFFFWLDLISTISLILDLQFFANNVFSSDAANTAQIARASRASRIGTKAGRVVRIIRLVRLAKLYKQVKHADESIDVKKRRQSMSSKVHPEELSQPSSNIQENPAAQINKEEEKKNQSDVKGSEDKISGKHQEENPDELKEEEDDDKDLPPPEEENADGKKDKKKKKHDYASESIFSGEEQLKESRVGKKLSDLTTKRVIVIVLLLLLFMPMFDSDFFNDLPPSNQYQGGLLAEIYNVEESTIEEKHAFRDYYVDYESGLTPPMVYVEIPLDEDYTFTKDGWDIDELRQSEKTEIFEETENYGTIYGFTTNREQAIFESGLNIGRTLFICVVLTFGAMIFSHDANVLVLTPIERMIEKVNKIAKNPMTARDEKIVKDDDAGAGNETVDIENAIVKIGGLLALGFGDAGSEIVAQNIAMGGDIDPMLPGKRKLAIFGFCDIRNFTDATEVLQKDVMIFVNSIGEIVHRVVDKYQGSANKNIGDAFLLVWKIPDSQIVIKNKELTVKNTRIIRNLADFSLMSFLKIFAKIQKDRGLMEYRKNQELCDRLPNYRVKMGFGLHVGWAIEGAIGSHFKIDASYLSPNVNMASRFEAATKQYGVPLLFSGDLYDLFSVTTKKKCRHIDTITVKGSIKPVRVYTCDVNHSDEIGISKDRSDMTRQHKRVRQQKKKKAMHKLMMREKASTLWETDKELKFVVSHHDPEFMALFRNGFDCYVKGDWATGKKRFEECLAMNPDDGPSKTLLSVLKSHDCIPPDEWDGYRVLTEK